MRITCPFCKSQADLKPNPAQDLRLPRYVLKCTGCDHTSIRVEPTRIAPAALKPTALKSA